VAMWGQQHRQTQQKGASKKRCSSSSRQGAPLDLLQQHKRDLEAADNLTACTRVAAVQVV
jgi:hypothetical protein